MQRDKVVFFTITLINIRPFSEKNKPRKMASIRKEKKGKHTLCYVHP